MRGERETQMKALAVGGAMLDTIAIIADDHIERMTMLNADTSFLLLEEGRKTEAVEISNHVGGGAVNAAVAMSRLGLDVAVLVKLGKDQRAETVLAHLMREGISTRWALRDGRAPTGASVLVSSHDRNAAIFTFRGANTLLDESDLNNDAFAVDVAYISSLSNESADTFPAIVRRAKAHKALVAANQERLEVAMDLYNRQIVELEKRDPYEAATMLTALEQQLEASYLLTARMNQLSLTAHL